MWRNLKLPHMWRIFRFIHICHVEKFKITPSVEKSQISPHLSCTETKNFSTWQIFSPRIYPWDPWQIWGMHICSHHNHLRRLCSISCSCIFHHIVPFPSPSPRTGNPSLHRSKKRHLNPFSAGWPIQHPPDPNLYVQSQIRLGLARSKKEKK